MHLTLRLIDFTLVIAEQGTRGRFVLKWAPYISRWLVLFLNSIFEIQR